MGGAGAAHRQDGMEGGMAKVLRGLRVGVLAVDGFELALVAAGQAVQQRRLQA